MNDGSFTSGLGGALKHPDVVALADILSGATVTGIGEATHGTSEFFQIRQQIIQALVERHGCREIALEAGWAETLPLNRYVTDGEGDPAVAVAHLGYWLWDVWEFRALVDWLRTWNADRPPTDRVQIVGIDCMAGEAAAELLLSLLTGDSDPLTSDVRNLLHECRSLKPWQAPADEVDAERVTQGLADLANGITASSLADSARQTALLAVTNLQQVDGRRRAESQVLHFSLRDEAMATNLLRLVRQDGRGGPTVFLAHNGHVTRSASGMFDPAVHTTGMYLSERLGSEYVSVGQLFGEGAFQAMVADDDDTYCLDEVTVGPPPSGSIDQRLLERSPTATTWFATTDPRLGLHPGESVLTRDIGAVFMGEADMHLEGDLTARHDMITFVPVTTRSHPTATGLRIRR